MKLKPLKNSGRIEAANPKILIIFGIIVSGLFSIIAYYSYALYKVNKTHNFAQGEVGSFSSGDIVLAVYVDGEKKNEFPLRTDGKSFEKVVCTNSGAADWDHDNWDLDILNIVGPTVCNVYFIDKGYLIERIKTDVIAKGQMKSGNPSFTTISNDADTGMYQMDDDDGTSYYFRGTKTLLNNNVIFAEHQWKIIRINGDRSIRLIYNGICPDNSCPINSIGTETQIGTSAFNQSSSTDPARVGYTYLSGSSVMTNSIIKGTNETWYQNNLNSYDAYIKDTIYCGDRKVTMIGEGWNFGARIRLINNKTPSLKCSQATDIYTKSTTIGNGLLTQKIGLITADEIAVAGGVSSLANNAYYLYSGQNYWSLSPGDWSPSSSVNNFAMYYTGAIERMGIGGGHGNRPVISLNSGVIISSGDGSESNPYVILTD